MSMLHTMKWKWFMIYKWKCPYYIYKSLGHLQYDNNGWKHKLEETTLIWYLVSYGV
jgi:hypothetical protein